MEYLKQSEIKIPDRLVLSKDDLESKLNIEGLLREIFFSIVYHNPNDMIRSYDIKNAYLGKLKEKGIDIDDLKHRLKPKLNYIQIFKNLVSSNVKNKTHFLRSPMISWIYGKGSDGKIHTIVARKGATSDLPDDFENKKRNTKNNYFVYLSEGIVDADKEIEAAVEIANQDSVSKPEKSSVNAKTDSNDISEPKPLDATEISIRVNQTVRNTKVQQYFRKRLLIRDSGLCAVDGCNISHPSMVEAAHIIPANEIYKDDKIDSGRKLYLLSEPGNGILLCLNHHKLFDLDIMRIDKSGKIHIESIPKDSWKDYGLSNEEKIRDYLVKEEKLSEMLDIRFKNLYRNS